MNILGLDANAVLGGREVTDDKRIIGDHGRGLRNDRGHIFAARLHGQRLSAAATMKSKPQGETWTHELWSTKTRRQIDYVLCDEVRHDSIYDVGTLDILEGKSDHRPVHAKFHLLEHKPVLKSRQRIQVGWKPALDHKGCPSHYHAALDVALSDVPLDLAETVVEVATASAAQSVQPRRKHNEEVQALFDQRRQEHDEAPRKTLSKQLWKALRRQRRQRADAEIERLAEKGSGLSQLRRTLQRQTGRDRINQVKDDHGKLHNDPDSICEVFAQFYEDLYRDEISKGGGIGGMRGEPDSPADPLTREEVERALRILKNGRTGAEDGLVAEMLKTGSRTLIEALTAFFNDILQNDLDTPDTWKKVKLKVIFKKGDPELPKNYRPISIIPVLAKLYSTILYNRMKLALDGRLADEQFGFRKGRGCADAVHILRTIIEKSAEWGEELWVATLDVEKAFDRVHHASLFAALMEGGADATAVGALRRLYSDMRASVVLWQGQESRDIDVQRGVRQGDPLSPLLFNLVINQVLEEVRPTWRKRGYGTNIGATVKGERLTHVAFADDMTLVSRSWLSMKRMLMTLRKSLAERGLALHPTKCKVQTNLEQTQKRGNINVEEGFAVEVLHADTHLVLLGTVLSLDDTSRHEVTNRIAAGWRMFWSMKPLLLNQNVSINRRLRLFNTTVGSCVTWCCESWTPRQDELRKLESARRSMLRKIVGGRRGPQEEWVDWIIRATHKALDWSKRAGVKDWRISHFERKWAWAGHVARKPADTWLYRVTTWRDSAWQRMCEELGHERERRPSRRRYMKWEDVLRRYCMDGNLRQWTEIAQERETWRSLADDFIAHSVCHAGVLEEQAVHY
jgi:hypothetical protein